MTLDAALAPPPRLAAATAPSSVKDLLTGPYDRAAVSVALAFATWQRLTMIDGLSDEQATDVMVRAVAGTLVR